MKPFSIFTPILRKCQALSQRISTALLSGHSDYFACFYPGNKGIVAPFLFNRLFSRIRVDSKKTAQLNHLNETGIVVYVGKYKSRIDFLFYRTIFFRRALPYPEIIVDASFFLLLPVKRVFQIFINQMRHLIRHFSLLDPFTSGYFFQAFSRAAPDLSTWWRAKGSTNALSNPNPAPCSI